MFLGIFLRHIVYVKNYSYICTVPSGSRPINRKEIINPFEGGAATPNSYGFFYRKKMGVEESLGCVYFIKLNGLTPIKIGYSTHPTPSGRVDAFATCAPFGVELVGFIQTKNSKQLETILHQRFSAFRCSGEWFDISKEQARSCCEQYMDDSQKDKLSKAYLVLSRTFLPIDNSKAVEIVYPIEFAEWVILNISFNQRLCKNSLFKKFIGDNPSLESKVSQRKFTSWVEIWCKNLGMECVQGKSDIRWIIIINNAK